MSGFTSLSGTGIFANSMTDQQ